MPERQMTIQVEPGSELDHPLEVAADTEILLEKAGVHYQLKRIPAPVSHPSTPLQRQHARNPERVLEIIGLGASAEGSNIANCKDQYLADAADHRWE